jgi:ABC-2 type transport system permease protein/ribosome-dependent ATPase
MSARRIWAVVRKEFREIFRDRLYFLLTFLLPPLLMFVFVYGTSQETEKVSFLVLDQDRTQSSRDYVYRYTTSRYFAYHGSISAMQQAERALAGAKVSFVLVIHEGFERELIDGRRAHVQTLLDGVLPFQVETILGYLSALNADVNTDLAEKALSRRMGITLQRARVILDPIHIQVRYLYNQQMRNISGVAASMVMFVQMLTVPLLAALSVVREKETGSIYNVYASTIGRFEFLAGKLIPCVLISLGNAMILWAIAVFHFQAPFKGSVTYFVGVTLAFVICANGIGLIISGLVRTQQGALMVSSIVAVLIGITYSGVITPIPMLTGGAYVTAHLLPAMYYHDAVTGVFLKGLGWQILWRPAAVIVVYAAILLIVAVSFFRKRRPV